MENKYKNQQELITGVLGVAGLIFVWVSPGTEHPALNLSLGIVFCLGVVKYRY